MTSRRNDKEVKTVIIYAKGVYESEKLQTEGKRGRKTEVKVKTKLERARKL